MPPFITAPPAPRSIGIPVIPRSPVKDTRARRPVENGNQRRVYGDEPLPLKPSEEAPRKGRIVGRIAEPDGVAYTVKIGETQLDNVELHEILNYVSPYDLEKFENEKFLEEREILKVAKREAEAEAERRRERQRHRTKAKGRVIIQEVSDGESDATRSADGGRSRPSYAPLYEKFRQRKRRRKRDPATGELIPLSDHESDDSAPPYAAPAVPELVLPVSNRAQAPPIAELPKRRRRRRDPVTGELMPLKPLLTGPVSSREPSPGPSQGQALLEKGKRPRRRRHPLTGELMPLGWRYDPEAEKSSYEKRRDGRGLNSPASKRLSITRGPEPKRAKTAQSSPDEVSQPSVKAASPYRLQATTQTTASPRFPNIRSEISESDKRPEGQVAQDMNDDSDEVQVVKVVQSSPRQPPSASRPASATKASMLRPVAQESAASSDASPEPINLKSFLGANRQRSSSEESNSSSEINVKIFQQQRPKLAAATMMNPVAAESESEDEEEDGDDDEDGYEVEDILAHHMSDPRTHPGKPAVMLYKTKWVGWDEPTWEPATSFDDSSIVQDYERKVGMRGASEDERMQL